MAKFNTHIVKNKSFILTLCVIWKLHVVCFICVSEEDVPMSSVSGQKPRSVARHPAARALQQQVSEEDGGLAHEPVNNERPLFTPHGRADTGKVYNRDSFIVIWWLYI